MAEHFAQGLDGDAISQGDGRRKGVPGQVRRDALLDAAGACQLLEVLIILGVAHYREQTIPVALRFVLAENLDREVEEFDRGLNADLDAVLQNPLAVVEADDQVFGGQRSDTRIIEAGHAAKDENVADFFEALRGRLVVNQTFEFFVRQVAAIFFLFLEFEIAERIDFNQPILPSYRHNALEDAHQFLGRIGIELVVHAQEVFEVHHKVEVDPVERDVFHPLLRPQKFCKPAIGEIILVKRRLCDVDTDQFFMPVVERGEDFQQGVVLHVKAQEGIAQPGGGSWLSVTDEFIEFGGQLAGDVVEDGIDLKGLWRAAFGSAEFGIPDCGTYI